MFAALCYSVGEFPADDPGLGPLLGLAQLLVLGLIVAVVMGTALTIVKLMRPPRRTYADAVRMNKPGDPSELDEPLAFETLTMRAADHTISVWSIQGGAPDGPDVLFVHGWSSSKMSVLPRLAAYAPVARRVIAIDLPGHGESPGWCALGVREPTVVDALSKQLDLDPANLVLAGSSLGGGVAIAAAARIEQRTGRSLRAVIAEGVYRVPWTPARAVLTQSGKPAFVTGRLALWSIGTALGVGPTFRGFDRARHAGALRAPLLVIHGSCDTISPPDDGWSIAEAAADGRFHQIEGASHHELWTPEHGPQTAEAIRDRCVHGPRVQHEDFGTGV